MTKKIYVTEGQMQVVRKLLTEDISDNQKTLVSFTGDNASEMGNNALEKYNDAQRAGIKADAITLDGKSTRNNATDNNEVVIGPDPNAANIKDAVTNAVNNAVNNGVDINKLRVQSNANDITNGTMTEIKRFKKSDVERARLYEMAKNGRIITKKDLMS